jgi:hypothetical protein
MMNKIYTVAGWLAVAVALGIVVYGILIIF